ncbi:hypothetical protein [Candidatus Mycoplasma haematohominis]|uniref:hypothetical protein n=1 Tax=Candidatus Mycoplasma haematohominis TaxID=1494318 RepID=UPI001C0A754E|nr:hypothetical protein [Candidatus Mycoplasma haemohominis]
MDPKLAIGAGVVVSAAATGYGVSSWLTQEPNKVHIKNAGTTEGHLNFDFQHHFVDASDTENDKWWDWAFKSRYSGKIGLSTQFESDIGNGSQLKSKCLTAYSQEIKTEIHPSDGDTNKTQYEKDIWTFCSIEGDKPITIEEADDKELEFKTGGTNANNFGVTNKKHVISTKDERNNKFWEIQAQAFFKSTDGLGSKATDASSEFSALYKHTDEKKKTVEELKKTCEDRYKTTSDTNKDKETFRFCSLKGKQD